VRAPTGPESTAIRRVTQQFRCRVCHRAAFRQARIGESPGWWTPVYAPKQCGHALFHPGLSRGVPYDGWLPGFLFGI